jgi:methionine-rich copper-binding protein CopC
MKKLLSAMSIILGLGLTTAQQTVPATKASTHQTVKTAKPATVTTAKPADAPAAAKMKKDGTPDKRYNANKNLKKDGTPDKRYKTNK